MLLTHAVDDLVGITWGPSTESHQRGVKILPHSEVLSQPVNLAQLKCNYEQMQKLKIVQIGVSMH